MSATEENLMAKNENIAIKKLLDITVDIVYIAIN